MITNGLIHIYEGDGKGKTTAAVGLSIRMLGNGGKVLFIQFLKGRQTGEIEPLKKLGATIYRTDDIKKFVRSMSPEELKQCKENISSCFDKFKDGLASGNYDLIVGDEILHAVNYGFINLDELLESLSHKSPSVEAVLTGRNPAKELIDVADYVTHMSATKHPYSCGISARAGIEY